MTGWSQDELGRWTYVGPKPPTLAEPTPLQKLVVRAVTITTIIVIPLGAIFVVNRNQTNNRVADNRAALSRETEIRQANIAAVRQLTLHFNRVNEWINFDNCVADEKQDAVIVSLLRSVPPAQRIPQVQDAIDALEPVMGDRVCIPPRGERPPEVRP